MPDAPTVKLEGPLPAWGDGVLRARWGDTLAAVVQGPPSVDPAALALARDRAAVWVARDLPHVLPLLGVARANGRECWFYRRPQGVSVAVLTEHASRLPPLRVAAEIVAGACEALIHLGDDGLGHPGPRPIHVLVDEGAEVTLAGFVGPAEREEDRTLDEPGLVFRLGHLWATLLTGKAPTPATDAKAHRGYLRRLMVAILARPGQPLPEQMRECLTATLAWEVGQRPGLDALPELLREGADLLGAEPDLATWAPTFLPAVRRRLEAEWEFEDEEGQNNERTDAGEHTQESDFPVLDLPQHEEGEVTAATGGRHGWPRDVTEHGVIPVVVGPPPEAVPPPMRLPSELFEDDEATGTHMPLATLQRMAMVSAVLALLALLLSAYVFAG